MLGASSGLLCTSPSRSRIYTPYPAIVGKLSLGGQVPPAYLAVLGQVERGDLLRLLDLLLVAPNLALQLVDQGLDRHGG